MVAFAGLLTGCSEQRAASPLSPSVLSERSSQDPRQATGTLTPRRVDNDGDGYDDGEPPSPPDPGTEPPPDPGTVPPPNPDQPPTDGVPAPVQLTITVVGSFGNGAFAPNPLQAAMGNTVVWVNNDFVVHDIVFDDGTPVGNLAPGQSSTPITLATETVVGFHCTFHPSMVGQVTSMPPAPPTDPSQGPPADPNAPPPPPPPDPYGDDPYGGDPYDGYGYLRTRATFSR